MRFFSIDVNKDSKLGINCFIERRMVLNKQIRKGFAIVCYSLAISLAVMSFVGMIVFSDDLESVSLKKCIYINQKEECLNRCGCSWCQNCSTGMMDNCSPNHLKLCNNLFKGTKIFEPSHTCKRDFRMNNVSGFLMFGMLLGIVGLACQMHKTKVKTYYQTTAIVPLQSYVGDTPV